MAKGKDKRLLGERANKLASAIEILRLLGFGSKQRNDAAGHTLLALLDLRPDQAWDRASDPLRGITPIIQFIREEYGVACAPYYSTRSSSGRDLKTERITRILEDILVAASRT